MSDQVVLPNGLGEAIIRGYVEDWQYEEDFDQAALDEFNANFEALGNKFLGNPKEPWYQGVDFTAAIRRKSDGALFGFTYWEMVSKHGEPYFEANGDEFDVADDAYVFLPVEPFTVQGYSIKKEVAA